MKWTNIFLIIIFLLPVACNSARQKDAGAVMQKIDTKVDSLQINKTVLKETFKQEDTAYNGYFADRLKPIRENFIRINSMVTWTSTDTIDLEESTEGGEAIFYYSTDVLEKMVTRHFGESFQQLTECYLLNGELSFVFEKSFKYNRPIYYDSTAMKENKDDQAFDFEKSEIIEDRSYFESGKLIHQVTNQDGGAPMADSHLLKEQKRLKTYFDELKAMTRQK